MLHWEYQDPVLTADTPEDEDGVYSGSALVEDDRMYLFYTGNVKKPGEIQRISVPHGSGDIADRQVCLF